jgi:hypothetical protein
MQSYRIRSIRIEIIHGRHRVVQIYTWAGPLYSNFTPSDSSCVNLHNSMPAMNYFDSNRTNTVIFNHSRTVYTRHLVAVPFTSFGNYELILNYLYLNEIF